VSSRLSDISRRKEILIAQSAREREELSAAFGQIRFPFEVGRVILGLTRTIKTHPVIAAGISSLVASGYASKLLRIAGEGLRLWRLLLPVWRWWKEKR
jgi:hypothetical protein